MSSEYQLDSIDKKILSFLRHDARTPFTEIAKRLNLSHGTIHQRVERLRSLGIIQGVTIQVDPAKLGFSVVTFIGVNLDKPSEYKAVIKKLESCPEVTEAFYTTGIYTFIIKVYSKSIADLHKFLIGTVQKIPLVRSTDTIVVLDTPLQRGLEVE